MLAGPYCTWVLGALGAEVTKVEMPGEGDFTRSIASFRRRRRASISRASIATNAASRSILNSRPGARALLRLADRADVFVENNRPGVMERLGLDYASRGAHQSTDRVRVDFRLWPDRPLSGAARVRCRYSGHGWHDEHHRRGRRRPGPRRRLDRRHRREPVRHHWHSGRTGRPRGYRTGRARRRRDVRFANRDSGERAGALPQYRRCARGGWVQGIRWSRRSRLLPPRTIQSSFAWIPKHSGGDFAKSSAAAI